MYEIEVKVRTPHDAVRPRLTDLDAELVATVVQEDVYFDHPARSFADTDEALRVRREEDAEGGVTETLTYKGPIVDAASKTREEREVGVASRRLVIDVLEALGFTRVATVRKDRERYRVGEYTVTLDAVPDLGEFVEVETEGSETAISEKRDGALTLLDRLGVDPDDRLRTSYLELLLDAGGAGNPPAGDDGRE